MRAPPLEPLAPFGAPPIWQAVEARLRGRPFLHSEGMSAPLGVPQRAAPWLLDESRRVVEVFHRFYRACVDADGALGADPARRLGEPYDGFAAGEGSRDPLPLGRYDCVLDADGGLRVIELNPIGVCTLHLRGISYLARTLVRMAGTEGRPELGEAARALDEVRRLKLSAIDRFAAATLASRPARPTAAILLMPGMHRASKLVWRGELVDAGWDVVFGTPGDVEVAGGQVRVAGRVVQLLWVDWYFYLGFQQTRYEQTKFASRVGDFSKAGAAADRLLRLPGLEAAVADRVATMLTPVRAYRALSKALLAWIERPGLPLAEADRAFLREHVARTYDAAAREAGAITPEEARRRREGLVLKPCRFGGSHGVALGRELDPDAWARRLDEIWADPEWVLQRFHEPILDARGDRLSFGLYDYGGELGGLLVRAAPAAIVSARTSSVIAALIGG